MHWSFSDPFGGVWIGLSDGTSEGTFRWPDGSHATYTKWASSLSRNRNVNHDCVRMTVDKGAWDDTSCGKELPFVCEKKIDTAPWYELELNEWKACRKLLVFLVTFRKYILDFWSWSNSIKSICFIADITIVIQYQTEFTMRSPCFIVITVQLLKPYFKRLLFWACK